MTYLEAPWEMPQSWSVNPYLQEGGQFLAEDEPPVRKHLEQPSPPATAQPIIRSGPRCKMCQSRERALGADRRCEPCVAKNRTTRRRTPRDLQQRREFRERQARRWRGDFQAAWNRAVRDLGVAAGQDPEEENENAERDFEEEYDDAEEE